MSRLTLAQAFLLKQKAFRKLGEAEQHYCYVTEKCIERDLFSGDTLNKNAKLTTFSKMDLSIAYQQLLKSYINYRSYCRLVDNLKKEKENERLK